MGLTKIFRDFWGQQRVVAVGELNLSVRTGEVFGLLGPNGSGKSTTLKMLLGLLFPSRGAARVLGHHPGHVKSNSRIGYLPEDSHLYAFLDARETLEFYGRLFGLKASERSRRTESLLEMVGLSSAARRPVGEYSKGMARRIGLAQALINDPDLLILDEPTAGLDPIGTRQIKDLIGELGQRGKTVLLCSHLLADVEDVCDRICILYGGRVQAEGSVKELLVREEMTQIRSGRLSPSTVEKVKEVIVAEHGDDEGIEVETPRIRLEEFFLQTVAQAQADREPTSGVEMGAGVSDFLRSEAAPAEGEAVIAGLVSDQDGQGASGQSSEHAGAEAVAIEPADTVRQDVLDSLAKTSEPVDAMPSDQSGPVGVDSISEQSRKQGLNRSVIDDLTADDATDNQDADQKADAEDDTTHPSETGGDTTP